MLFLRKYNVYHEILLLIPSGYWVLKVQRMVVSTYQAASGAGAAAMEELELQTREVYSSHPISLH